MCSPPAHPTTAGSQRMGQEMANRLRSVLDDQRLISLDTLFALDDGLSGSGQEAAKNDSMIALAGELRESRNAAAYLYERRKKHVGGGSQQSPHRRRDEDQSSKSA